MAGQAPEDAAPLGFDLAVAPEPRFGPASGRLKTDGLPQHVAAQLDYSQTGDTTRERFTKTGIEVLLATALIAWQGSTAQMMNLYTGDIEERSFDSLVLATTNEPDDRLSNELAACGLEVHTIGDAVQARTASMAIYEARELAMRL